MEYLNWHRDSDYYICKRLRLLDYLMEKGFKPKKTLPDARNPKYNVWIFDNSPELADSVEDFIRQQMNRPK